MNIRTLAGLVVLATAASSAACGGDNHSNANHSNANTARPAATATPAATPTPRAGINTNMSRPEYDRNRDSVLAEARSMGRTIGSGAEDGWLWLKVRGALAAADDLRDSTINVDVDNAVVTLSGTVANGAQMPRAVQVAGGVEGVKRPVKNNLTVRSGNASPGR